MSFHFNGETSKDYDIDDDDNSNDDDHVMLFLLSWLYPKKRILLLYRFYFVFFPKCPGTRVESMYLIYT